MLTRLTASPYSCRPRSAVLPFIRVNSFAVVLLLIVGGARNLEADEPIDFNRDIRPILSENCFFCHGPDAAAREADLRLDREETAKEWVITPGKPDESELLRRVMSSDESEQMPPPDSGRSVTATEKDLLRRWIEQGAVYQSHWSLIPPVQPELPTVTQLDWCRNEIDHFVLAQLEAASMQPGAEASKETLIRRVTFDLTGLPPTLAEIDAFLADESPLAYEAVVDRLLASPSYGERMTADWLDVARYSDTYGYQVDRDRFVWPWRDWVIRAFNDNMPYDEFVTQQLAGDLLEGAGRDEILATTFNRLHPQKVEGGSVPEEFRIEYVADRAQTFATAFLGMTLECCRCHDHKYDPLTQREYYQLSAFFDNIDEAGLYSYFTPAIPTPTLLLPTTEQETKLEELRQRIVQAEARLTQLRETRQSDSEQWLRSARSLRAPGESHSEDDDADSKTNADLVHAGSVHYGMAAPLVHLTFDDPPGEPNEQVDGVIGKAVRLTGDDPVNTEVGNFQRSQPFSVSLWMNTPDVKERAVVFHRSRAWTDAASRGYQLLIEEGRLSWSLIHFWPGNAISIRTTQPLPTNEWLHVTVTYDGSSRADGLALFINGEPASTEVVRDGLTKQITGGGGDHIAIGERFRDRGFTDGLVDEFRVYDRQLSSIEVAQLHDGESLTVALQTPFAELTPAQRSALESLYLAFVDEEMSAQRDAIQRLRAERNTLLDGVDEIMVMRELDERQRQPTYLLKRGAYDAHGDEVTAQTPASLNPFPAAAPRNRLGLAQWLTNSQHPLTSRVAVNRLWQMCFGRGLVTTPEDFGSQGKPPTHPQLLDWLAVDFVAGGWNVKRLLRQIVTSSTYKQSSAMTSAADPENRLLGRGPSYRLPAEMLRDNALAVSGLLVDRMGGPPVKPYEVEESFKPAKRDEGDGLYRRSLYTYWKRTGPAPAMMTLDAAKRDVCRVSRERTASPLQALVLLNGPQYIEATRATAERLIHQHSKDAHAQLINLFRLLTSRTPTKAELAVLQSLYDEQLQEFQSDNAAAVAYLTVGDRPRDELLNAPEVAALASVAGALLNFDECVTKR